MYNLTQRNLWKSELRAPFSLTSSINGSRMSPCPPEDISRHIGITLMPVESHKFPLPAVEIKAVLFEFHIPEADSCFHAVGDFAVFDCFADKGVQYCTFNIPAFYVRNIQCAIFYFFGRNFADLIAVKENGMMYGIRITFCMALNG